MPIGTRIARPAPKPVPSKPNPEKPVPEEKEGDNVE